MRVSLFLLLAACPPSKDDSVAAETTWFYTCGDPACQGYTGPFDGVDLCDDETVGDLCTDEGATCDPQDSCNALVICAAEDPTQQEGGCPISRKRHKRDIRYLGDAEQASLATAAAEMKLARWSYNWDPRGAPPHLGFLIDDVEGSPAVTADGDHVDLYGYTSVVLALAQEQGRTIAAQAARLDEQEARLADQEARLSALEARLAGVAGR